MFVTQSISEKNSNTKNAQKGIQQKLKVNKADDPAEKEANAMADMVVKSIPNNGNLQAGNPSVQRKTTNKEASPSIEESKLSTEEGIQQKSFSSGPPGISTFAKDTSFQRSIQRMQENDFLGEFTSSLSFGNSDIQMKAEEGGMETTQSFEEQLHQEKGKGASLSDKTRSMMEPPFGSDLGEVRVHTGSKAESLNEGIGSRAFTHGNDIYFNKNEYNPETEEGNKLIAHEVTHTFQQGAISRKKIQQKPKEKTSPSIPSEEVPLSMLFQPSVGIAKYIEENKRGAEIRAKYKNFASGTIKIRKSHDGSFSSAENRYDLLPLNMVWLQPLKNIGIHPHLAILIKKNEVQGYVDFSKSLQKYGWGGKQKDKIRGILNDHKDTLGLIGFDRLRIPKIKNELKDGNLVLGIEGIKVRLGGFVDGSISLSVIDDNFSLNGEAAISIPKLQTTNIQFSRDVAGNVSGKGSIGIDIKNFSGKVQAEFLNGFFDIKGDVTYRTEKLSGTVHIVVTDAKRARQVALEQLPPQLINQEAVKKAGFEEQKPGIQPGPRAIAGWGNLEFHFNDWIVGTALVVVDNEGHVTVQGEIAPPGYVTLFPAKPFGPYVFIDIHPKFRWGIPYIADVHVGLIIKLHAEAQIGPALLKNIKIKGTYSTDPLIFNNFRLEASLSMQAYAALVLAFGASLGVGILGFDIDGEGQIDGKLGIRGYVEANPVVGYREKADPEQGKKGEFFLSGDAELAAQPFLGLSGKFSVFIDSPWPIPNKRWTWPLFDKEYPLPGEFGVGLKMGEYVLGSGEWPQIDWGEAKFDRDKFMDDVIEKRVPEKQNSNVKPKQKFNDKLKGQTPEPTAPLAFSSEKTGNAKSDKKKQVKGIPEPKLRDYWIKGMTALKRLKDQSDKNPFSQERLKNKLLSIQNKYKFQSIEASAQDDIWVVSARMNEEIHNKHNPIGIKVKKIGETSADAKTDDKSSQIIGLSEKVKANGGHKVTIEGNLAQAQIVVYSTRIGLNELLRRKLEEIDALKKAGTNVADKLKALNVLNTEKKAFGHSFGIYKSAVKKGLDGGSSNKTTLQNAVNQIKTSLKKIADNLEIVGIAVNIEDPLNPPTLIKPRFTNGAKASSFQVQYLKTGRLKGGSPASANDGRTLAGWSEIQRRGLSEKAAWVKMHLLTEILGGPAKDTNLIPARGPDTNLRFRDSVEHPAKADVDKGHVIWYDVSLSYHGAPDQDFPSYLKMEWGPHVYENNTWLKKPSKFNVNGKSIGSSDNQNLAVPPITSGDEVLNINTAGRVRIEALDPVINRRFAEIITEEVTNAGKFSKLDDLIVALQVRQVRSPDTITKERIEALKNAESKGVITFK